MSCLVVDQIEVRLLVDHRLGRINAGIAWVFPRVRCPKKPNFGSMCLKIQLSYSNVLNVNGIYNFHTSEICTVAATCCISVKLAISSILPKRAIFGVFGDP